MERYCAFVLLLSLALVAPALAQKPLPPSPDAKRLKGTETPAELFKRYNASGSGKMTLEEFEAFLKDVRYGPRLFTGEPPAVPKGASKVYRDLDYAVIKGKSLRLDLYLPEKAGSPVPLIVQIHGGGWLSGTKNLVPPAIFLTSGYAVASIDYRLSGQAIFPAAIQDCKAAVRWLRANARKYDLDPDRFAAWGPSAGGHLVALLGTSGGVKEFDVGDHPEVSSRVQAVCDWFGPIDFLQMDVQAKAAGGGRMSHDDAKSEESRFVGGPIQENMEKCARANPVTHVTKDSPPFLIIHGTKDPWVPLAQSELLVAALKKAGVEVTLHVLDGAGHGGPEFQRPEIQQQMVDFFDKHLKKSSSKKPVDPAR